MLQQEEFKEKAHQLVDWMAKYLEEVEQYPVLSQVKPGEVAAKIPASFPEEGEKFDDIFQDFEEKVMPGITHWESPNFFAYFPASKSRASILAEMITATLGVQGMLWMTSPAATELEDCMMVWMQQLLGLPENWTGSIQDTASNGTLNALLTAREKATNYQINENGFYQQPVFRIYCSEHAHSSIDKNVKIAGFGSANLVKVAVDEAYAMLPEDLEKAILADKAQGFHPLFVMNALGTTSSTAVDPLNEIADICNKHELWLHVDAAYSGAALIIEENRWMSKGMEKADSFVFNPHKWLFTNFDCSLYYVKDKQALINTFSITPEYLKTDNEEEVNNYRDWHIQLGRRFRSLKLWFVLRNFGAKSLRGIIQNHCDWAAWLGEQIEEHPNFELLAPIPVNLVCFRYVAENKSEEELNQLNEFFLKEINGSGKIYMTHTKLDGKYTLRWVGGHAELTKKHVENAWKIIKQKVSTIEQ
jgi:aromatic-L-amino-acid decarboxylase